MHSLDEFHLESKNRIKINFNGGDLSFDAELIPINEFASKIGFDKLIHSKFKTNDSVSFRYHTGTENMMQKIYQTIAAYFRDNDGDELTNDPVFNTILDKRKWLHNPPCHALSIISTLCSLSRFCRYCVNAFTLSKDQI